MKAEIPLQVYSFLVTLSNVHPWGWYHYDLLVEPTSTYLTRLPKYRLIARSLGRDLRTVKTELYCIPEGLEMEVDSQIEGVVALTSTGKAALWKV